MGAKVFRDRGCDTIVAVGGESAMDAARRIKLFCSGTSTRIYRKQEQAENPIPLVAVPATYEVESA